MSIAWSLKLRRGAEPGWRQLALGGVGAAVLLGFPLFMLPPMLGDATSDLLHVGEFLYPMVLLTVAAVLVLEGFRAAAT